MNGDVPVFSENSAGLTIQGYLRRDAVEGVEHLRAFEMVATVPESVTMFDPDKLPEPTMLQKLQLEWIAIKIHSRSRVFRARCLKVRSQDTELLDRVRGFKWFAEVHGEQIA